MDERVRKMLEKLCEKPAGASALASVAGVTAKTARTLLSQAQKSAPGWGCRLEKDGFLWSVQVEDPDQFSRMVLHPGRKPENPEADSTRNFRISYMLSVLLSADGYVRIEDLADALYVSRATLDRLMPQLKKKLQPYHLQLVSTPRRGLKIEGSEFERRLCYASAVERDRQEDREKNTVMQTIVMECIRKHALQISDANFYNLCQHCMIALRRMQAGSIMESTEDLPVLDPSGQEYACACEICTRMEREFSLKIPEAETTYICLHLLGKETLENTSVLKASVLADTDQILEEIWRTKGIDLRKSSSLRTALALHLQPLLMRLELGLHQPNPILSQIRQDLPEGYELALCAMEVIYRQYGFLMDESEAGYLAMHFQLALEEQAGQKQEKNILIVCASGRGTSRLLQHRLVQMYHFHPDQLQVVSAFALDTHDFSNDLCILSTIPLQQIYPVPLIEVDLTMNENSRKRMDDFFSGRLPGNEGPVLPYQTMVCTGSQTDRREILKELSREACRAFGIRQDLAASVWKRETMSSTESGLLCALPHPYEWNEKESFLAVMILEKPVQWKFQKVQAVFLSAVSDNPAGEQMIQNLAALVSDDRKVRQLITHPEKETLEQLLQEGGI